MVSVTDKDVADTLKASFSPRGSVKLDRLDQSELQRACSEYARSELPQSLREKLQTAALTSVKYPADGNYLGNWKKGEKIAQTGKGMQY
ncbi:MAG: sulfur oxidation c-type cytochrome SoxX, partial [Quisquiliibacterium sp.]